MLQNFLYLYKKKTQVPKRFTSTSTSFFRFSLQATFIFPIMNALVYVDIDQGIFKVKMKVAQNVKVKKLLGFSFYINIGNSEAFLWNLNLSTNRLFWRCVWYVYINDKIATDLPCNKNTYIIPKVLLSIASNIKYM